MIINGASRAGAKQLSTYLMRNAENERADILSIDGVAVFGQAEKDLQNAFAIMQSCAAATRGRNGLYHSQLSPEEDLTDAQWLRARDILAEQLGFDGQASAVVLHRKEGTERTHAHIVYQRTDLETGTLRSDSWDYIGHEAAARLIEFECGHACVPGKYNSQVIQRLRDQGRSDAVQWMLDNRALEREPEGNSYNEAEKHQYERGADQAPEVLKPNERKALVKALNGQADSGQALVSALETNGLIVAQGRKLVVVDAAGQVHGLARQAGLKEKELRERLADVDLRLLPNAEQVASEIKARQKEQAAVAEKTHDQAPDKTLELKQSKELGTDTVDGERGFEVVLLEERIRLLEQERMALRSHPVEPGLMNAFRYLDALDDVDKRIQALTNSRDTLLDGGAEPEEVSALIKDLQWQRDPRSLLADAKPLIAVDKSGPGDLRALQELQMSQILAVQDLQPLIETPKPPPAELEPVDLLQDLEPKALIAKVWEQTESGEAFKQEMEIRDYVLAQGKRGVMLVTPEGEFKPLARYLPKGFNKRQVEARLKDVDCIRLPDVETVSAAVKAGTYQRLQQKEQQKTQLQFPTSTDVSTLATKVLTAVQVRSQSGLLDQSIEACMARLAAARPRPKRKPIRVSAEQHQAMERWWSERIRALKAKEAAAKREAARKPERYDAQKYEYFRTLKKGQAPNAVVWKRSEYVLPEQKRIVDAVGFGEPEDALKEEKEREQTIGQPSRASSQARGSREHEWDRSR